VTPEQASDGFVELILPEGGRVLVDIRNDVERTADLEADVVQLLFEADGSDDDVCSALRDLAHDSGLTAKYSVGRDSVIVALRSR
jgi:hypothetical protein